MKSNGMLEVRIQLITQLPMMKF